MTTARRSERALAVWLALSLWAAPVLAGEQDAQTLFAEARRMRQEGDCAGAIVRFRQALASYPEGLGSLRNIAECEEELGRFASARRSWWKLRREALKSAEPKYEGWAAHAEQAHARLDGKVPRLTVSLVGGKLDDVRVVIDEKDLPARLVGVPVERDVGEHVVEVWYGARKPFQRTVDLVEGARETVTFTLPISSGGDDHQRKPPPPESDRSGLRTAGFVALGIGGLGAVGFGVALGIRQAALADLEELCPTYESGPCGAEASDAVDRGTTASLLVNVFGAVAAAGLISGTVLVVVGSTGESAETSLVLRPLPGGGAAQATVRY